MTIYNNLGFKLLICPWGTGSILLVYTSSHQEQRRLSLFTLPAMRSTYQLNKQFTKCCQLCHINWPAHISLVPACCQQSHINWPAISMPIDVLNSALDPFVCPIYIPVRARTNFIKTFETNHYYFHHISLKPSSKNQHGNSAIMNMLI